jgi:hypothetical protein
MKYKYGSPERLAAFTKAQAAIPVHFLAPDLTRDEKIISHYSPACGVPETRRSQATHSRRLVSCGNCLKTKVYR